MSIELIEAIPIIVDLDEDYAPHHIRAIYIAEVYSAAANTPGECIVVLCTGSQFRVKLSPSRVRELISNESRGR